MQPCRHLAQISIWRGGLGTLDIYRHLLKPQKIKWIQRSTNHSNALWKGIMLYLFNLILSSNEGLTPF